MATLTIWQLALLDHIRAHAPRYDDLHERAQEMANWLIHLGLVKNQNGKLVAKEETTW